MSEKKLLIVDDETVLLEALSAWFTAEGYAVVTAENGRQALALFDRERFDFVILDLMLPEIPGEAVCRSIRARSDVPILMLTAKSMDEDVVHGLQLGADDYVTKPVSMRQLSARMEAILRRTSAPRGRSVDVLRCGELTVDLHMKSVRRGNEDVSLTPIEWNILCALLRAPNKVFTREELLEIAFEPGYDGTDRVIDTHIKNLRKKLGDGSRSPHYIRTVYGIGYRFGGAHET